MKMATSLQVSHWQWFPSGICAQRALQEHGKVLRASRVEDMYRVLIVIFVPPFDIYLAAKGPFEGRGHLNTVISLP